jgi:hypothetical protein
LNILQPSTLSKNFFKKWNCSCYYGQNTLKGTVQRDFYLQFFHRWTPPKPITWYVKTLLIWLQIRGDICNFWLTLH